MFSATNGNQKKIDKEIQRIVKTSRSIAGEADRDLFDHLMRRSNAGERARMSKLASDAGANLGWLDAIIRVAAEKEHVRD
jgi:hypothetical protein